MFNNGSAMKKLVLILILIMFCSLAAAVVLYVVDGGSDNFIQSLNGTDNGASSNSRQANSGKVDEEKQESLSGIETVNVSDVSEDIKFIPVDNGDTIKACLSGKYSSGSRNYKPSLTVSKSGSNIDVKVEYPKRIISIFNFNADLKLDVYIPKSYSGNLKVSTTSADTEIGEMNLKSFKYSTVSGELTAKSLNSGKTELHSTSGSVNINGSMGDFIYTSVSGDIESDNFAAASADIDVTSSEASLKGNPGDIHFNSVSGGLELEYDSEYASNIAIGTTSGDASIKLPSDSQFGVNFSSTSGEAACDFPITVSGSQGEHKLKGNVGNGSNTIKMNSISGGLQISNK